MRAIVERVRRSFVPAVLALLVIVGASRPARAAEYDLTNHWVVGLVGFSTCTWDLVQTGTSLHADLACPPDDEGTFDGALDPDTGAVTGTIVLTRNDPPSAPVELVWQLAAQVLDDGRRIDGTTTGSPPTGFFRAVLCGNGRLDAGEQCDDTANSYDDCCTFSCTFEPDGTTCLSNACAVATSCQAGACVGAPLAAGTVCDVDGNSCTTDACDGAGACAAGPCSPCCGGPGCTADARWDACIGPTDDHASLQLQTSFNGTRDSLRFTIRRGEATSESDLGNPETDTDYAVCLFRPAGPPPDRDVLVGHAILPGGQTCNGRSCWRRSPKGALIYRNARREPNGIASMTIAPGGDGASSVKLSGRGPKLYLPDTLPGSLKLEVRAADACWGAFFVVPAGSPGVLPTLLRSADGIDR